MPELRQSFSRTSKLLTMFGFGADTPYASVQAIRKGQRLTVHDRTETEGNSGEGNGANNQFDATWYAEMAEYSPIAMAIRLLTEEAIQTEATCPGTLWVEGGSTEVQTTLTDLINNKLEMEDCIRAQFFQVIVGGNNFEKLILGPEGVHGWHYVDTAKMKRVVDGQRRLVGFTMEGEEPPVGLFALAGTSNVKNLRNDAKIWMPWSFVHFRLMGKDRGMEMGTSLLKDIASTYNRLRMVEDSMVAYRLQMMPSRWSFKLDTGTSDVTDIGALKNRWRNELTSTRNVDSKTGLYNHRYSPPSLSAFVIYPVRKESASSLDKIQGDNDVPDIPDVEHLYRQLGGVLGIPPEFLGAKTEGNSGFKAESSLATQDLRFQRTIKTLRQPVIRGYDRVCRIHLALTDKDPYEPFVIKMSNITAVEATSQMELVSAQADLAQKLMSMGDSVGLPKDEWVRYVFTRFLPLPRDILDPLLVSLAMKHEDPQGEQSGATSGPSASPFEASGSELGGDFLDDAGLPSPESSSPTPEAPAPTPADLSGAPNPAEAGPAPTPSGPAIAPSSLNASKYIDKLQRTGRILTEAEAILVYNRRLERGKRLNLVESRTERLTEGVLRERRKKLREALDNAKKKIGTDSALRVSIGRVMQQVYGYTPEIYTERGDTIVENTAKYRAYVKAGGNLQSLTENTATPRPGTEHEALTRFKSGRRA